MDHFTGARPGGRPRVVVSKTDAKKIQQLRKDGLSEREIVEEINRRWSKENKLSRDAGRRVLSDNDRSMT